MNKLRFKDFNGQQFPEWEIVELEKVSTKVNQKNKELTLNNVLTNSATQGIISQSDYFERDIANQNNLGGYYIVQTNDFVYNPRISIHALVGPIKRNNLTKGVMSPLYTVFRFKEGDLDFFEQYFQTNHWHDYMKSVSNSGARYDRMNITNESFFGLPLPYPSIPEQTKIANFLTAVDEKISHLTQKHDLLTQYKKGVMQQIFSQELRFKDDDGQDFPEWDEKTLKELIDTVIDNRGKTPPVESAGNPLIEVNAIGNKDVKYSAITKYVSDETYQSWFRNHIREGDVLFSTVGATAQCSYFKDVGLKATIAQNIVGLRFKPTYSSLFMFYLLTEKNNNQKFKTIEMGAVQPSVKVSQMIHLHFNFPSQEEQTKIASFLTAIDDKITATQTQLQAVKQYKKGLLQQMFV